MASGGEIISKGIVIGTVAQWMGKKADAEKTHKWTCYVRGAGNEDTSYFIRKVAFQLHASFDKPKRESTKPPFEVTEYGWGEFEIGIRIYFTDSQEKHIDAFHQLKLFHNDGTVSKKPVISERYDTIVFENPSEAFSKKLMKHNPSPSSQEKILHHPSVDSGGVFDEEEYQQIVAAQKKIREELRKVKELCEQVDGEIGTLSKNFEGNNPGVESPFKEEKEKQKEEKEE